MQNGKLCGQRKRWSGHTRVSEGARRGRSRKMDGRMGWSREKEDTRGEDEEGKKNRQRGRRKEQHN